MVCISFLEEGTIDKSKTATAGTYFFLHANELGQVGSGFLGTQFIAPFFYSACRETNATDAGNRTGNMQHVLDIFFDTRTDGFLHLFVRYLAFFLWIIQLTFRRES